MARYYARDEAEPALAGWYTAAAREPQSSEEDDNPEGVELASIEALEAILAAHAPRPRSSAAPRRAGRRQYSAPWLEQLFQALHQDLVALTEWSATARVSSRGRAADEPDDEQERADDPEAAEEASSAPLVPGDIGALASQRPEYYQSDSSGSEGASNADGSDGSEGEQRPRRRARAHRRIAHPSEAQDERTGSRPSADWLRLGELAERLDSLDDACRAYHHAAQAVPPSYVALRRLLLLFTRCGRLAEALAAADELCVYLSSNLDGADEDATPAVVSCCVAQLAAEHGLDEMRAAVLECAGGVHRWVSAALVDAVVRLPADSDTASDFEAGDERQDEQEEQDATEEGQQATKVDADAPAAVQAST